eukprot:IDg17760t1
MCRVPPWRGTYDLRSRKAIGWFVGDRLQLLSERFFPLHTVTRRMLAGASLFTLRSAYHYGCLLQITWSHFSSNQGNCTKNFTPHLHHVRPSSISSIRTPTATNATQPRALPHPSHAHVYDERTKRGAQCAASSSDAVR